MKCPTAQRGLSVGGAVLVDEIVKGASVRQQDSEWAKIPKKEKKGAFTTSQLREGGKSKERKGMKREEKDGEKKGNTGAEKKKKSQKHRWYVWSDTVTQTNKNEAC